MKKYALYIRNIFLILFATFLIHPFYLKDATAKVITPSTNLAIEDIKKIPIIGYKLVYKEYTASLIDFLEEQKTDFINSLKSSGITPHNIVIIFTNYESNKNRGKDLNTTESSIHIQSPYVTDEGNNLDLSNFYYSDLPFLLSKRSVLLGTLVDDSNAIRSNEKFNVVKFNMPDSTGFQIPIKRITSTKEVSKKDKKNKQQPINTNYSLEELLSNRISMIGYMSLSNFSKTNFIGMLEYKDLSNNLYSYFSLPGTLSVFLNNK